MDESIIIDFLNETKEFLEKLDTELVELETNPDDKERLADIFRMIHTIKGTSGFLGFERLGEITHAGENILSELRDGKLKADPNIISSILSMVDAVRFIVESIEKDRKEPPGDDKELIEQLNLYLESKADEKVDTTPVTEEIKPDEIVKEELAPPSEKQEPVLESNQKSQENPEEGEPSKKESAAIQNIRVNVDVLEGLMHNVSELVLTRNQLLQVMRHEHNNVMSTSLQRLSYITTELQEGIMKTRMQPIGNAWAQFPRMVRDLSKQFNKKINLHMHGKDTELDRQLIELIKDPLTHMVRNAVDHAIEMPEERMELDKPETGNIYLKAYHKGGHIFIEISDDGKGIDVGKIKRRAIESGIVRENDLASLTDQQIQQYIFKPGFSTAEKVTAVSGRGVGMDVVRHNIEKISGMIECKSILGRGTSFIIKIPLTLAIMSVLLVKCRNARFGIPQISVLEMIKVQENSEHEIEMIHGHGVLRLRNELIPLIFLSEVLKMNSPEDEKKEGLDSFCVICEVGNVQFGVIVDRIYDTEEIVVNPVSHLLRHVDLYSGSTLLGDGSIIMVLDTNGLIKYVNKNPVILNEDVPIKTKEVFEEHGKGSRFLQFRVAKQAPKLLPLNCIARLEELDLSKLEKTSGNYVLQYRGSILHIVTIDPSIAIPTSGIHEIVVVSHHGHMMGLVVDEVLDIVEKEVKDLVYSQDDPYCGVMVVNETACDVVNLDYYYRHVFKDWEGGAVTRSALSDGPHILLIDDSPFFRKIIPPTLELHGYLVSVAESVDDAIGSLLEMEKKPDLVIVDMHMPEKDGHDFVQECRAHSHLKAIPIIALTPQMSIEGIKNQGMMDGVTCKTNHDHLLHTIENILSRQKEDG